MIHANVVNKEIMEGRIGKPLLLSEFGNIPDDYLDAELSEIAGKEGEAIRQWWSWYHADAPYYRNPKRKSSLLLHGAFGHGKTAAAVAVAKKFWHHGASLWFQSELTLVDDWRSKDQQRSILGHHILVFDDVGAKQNDHFGSLQDIRETIIRTRKDRNLPTIMTTNLDQEKRRYHFEPFLTILGSCYTVVRFRSRNWRAEQSQRFRIDVDNT